VPKDGKPDDPRSARAASDRGSSASSGGAGGGSRPASGRSNGGKGGAGKGSAVKGSGGKGGRTRPAANVVSPQRPWGLIAAAIAVVVFAGAVLTYAVLQVRESEANEAGSVDDIPGVQSWSDLSQDHVTTTVDYEQSPPVGGPHDPEWADCTGTVYDVEIRHENAVHSLEHGGVWITYDPEAVSADDIDTLAELADESGRMLSPYAGLDSPISIQAWGHQLKVDSADDPRLAQFADLLTFAANLEPGATCENPRFIEQPRVPGDPSGGDEASTDMSVPTDAEVGENSTP
jgi:hypothetical protein